MSNTTKTIVATVIGGVLVYLITRRIEAGDVPFLSAVGADADGEQGMMA